MELHRRIGLGFATFCVVMLGWTLMTPENPQHVTNLIIHGVLAPLFAFSSSVKVKAGAIMQVSGLFFGAILTAMCGDFQPASAVGSVAILLIYAYGGFKSISPFVILPVSTAQFGLTTWAAIIAGFDLEAAMGHAVAWTSFSLVGVWAVWLIFQNFALDMIKQNRELLEVNKKLLNKNGECKDGAARN